MKAITCVPICLALLAATPRAAAPQAPAGRDPLLMMRVNGVELHYVDRGKGVPVVLVHGGLEDYRAWTPHIEALARRHRTVAYSRRFDYPNRNTVESRAYSAAVDAADLAALIRRLNLAPAHVVGVSYGAYGALLLAAKHPSLVRSLVLAEPPLVRWLPKLDGGRALFDDFMARVWEPGGTGFEGKDDPNAAEWRALAASRDAFPDLSRGTVKDMKMPVLLLSGQRSLPMHALIDQELERLLPRAERVILPGATHGLWSEFPEQCRAAALAFFAKH